ERDPAGQRVELELVIQDLDDDQRAREAHARREVEQLVVMRRVLHPEQIEESEAQRDTDRDLKSTGQQDRGAARRHLSQVDLETDHEEQRSEEHTSELQ